MCRKSRGAGKWRANGFDARHGKDTQEEGHDTKALSRAIARYNLHPSQCQQLVKRRRGDGRLGVSLANGFTAFPGIPRTGLESGGKPLRHNGLR